MTFPASKIISTLVASWMLVGCLLCSCVNAAIAAAADVPVAVPSGVVGEMGDDHACCPTQKPVELPCHSSSDPNDASDCGTCPAMSAKIAPATADVSAAKVLLSPWQFEAAFALPEIMPVASPVSAITDDDRPRSLATPLQMKCALLL
ncbi:MAG TPA: hypothetical protein VGN72_09945 [Tepidisphaeraceae bacterium]|jgi:hypothetical protein|nr:hypothetical protein [Tepidisphaeraceae bacterium]